MYITPSLSSTSRNPSPHGDFIRITCTNVLCYKKMNYSFQNTIVESSQKKLSLGIFIEMKKDCGLRPHNCLFNKWCNFYCEFRSLATSTSAKRWRSWEETIAKKLRLYIPLNTVVVFELELVVDYRLLLLFTSYLCNKLVSVYNTLKLCNRFSWNMNCLNKYNNFYSSKCYYNCSTLSPWIDLDVEANNYIKLNFHFHPFSCTGHLMNETSFARIASINMRARSARAWISR